MNKHIQRICVRGFMVFACLGLHAAADEADDLTPPGPPGSEITRMKTLNQIEPRTFITELPFTITQPGAYYLTSDLTGVAGSSGILIDSDHVQLDLSGYALIGVSNSHHGIVFISGTNRNSVIRNGFVRNWGMDGIHAVGAYDCQLMDVITSHNGQSTTNAGVRVQDNWVIQRCGSHANEGDGFITPQALLQDGTARWNRGSGFNMIWGGRAQGCNSLYNSSNGFVTYGASIIMDSNAYGNFGVGIDAGNQSRIVNNTVSSNGGITESPGILVGNDCRIESNHLVNNGGGTIKIGIKTSENSARSLIIGNSATGHTINYDLNENTHYGQVVPPQELGNNFYASPWSNFEL